MGVDSAANERLDSQQDSDPGYVKADQPMIRRGLTGRGFRATERLQETAGGLANENKQTSSSFSS